MLQPGPSLSCRVPIEVLSAGGPIGEVDKQMLECARGRGLIVQKLGMTREEREEKAHMASRGFLYTSSLRRNRRQRWHGKFRRTKSECRVFPTSESKTHQRPIMDGIFRFLAS